MRMLDRLGSIGQRIGPQFGKRRVVEMAGQAAKSRHF
jgi:hypothetical protein